MMEIIFYFHINQISLIYISTNMIFKYDKYGFIPIDLICLNHGSSKIILSNTFCIYIYICKKQIEINSNSKENYLDYTNI